MNVCGGVKVNCDRNGTKWMTSVLTNKLFIIIFF